MGGSSPDLALGAVRFSLLAIVAGMFAISALGPGSRLNGWGMMRPWMMGGFGSPFMGGLVMLLVSEGHSHSPTTGQTA